MTEAYDDRQNTLLGYEVVHVKETVFGEKHDFDDTYKS
jgi:hypothetical protein